MAVKARDLRVAIKDMGFERGVVHTLELLLEEHAETRQRILLMGDVLVGCVENVEKMVQVGTGMHAIIKDIQRIAKQDGADDQKGQE